MLLVLPLLLGACSPTADDSGGPGAVTDWSLPGRWSAGTTLLSLAPAGRDAPIPARAWYPVDPGEPSTPMEALIPDPEDATTFAALLAESPPDCATRDTPAAVDAPAAAVSDAPLLVFSHCHSCLGVSGAAIAAHLASHGFVVVAPDHVGDDLFDALAGQEGSLDEATLAQRAADASAALDLALTTFDVDPTRVGAIGHSFGAVTVGRLLGTDDRVRAGFAMGAPVDNPLLEGVDAATVTEPLLHLLLEEDHSIGALGNSLIESNYAELPGPAWLVRMPDAGHWTVSDLCGLVDDFDPGCGEDTREEGGEPFTYVSPAGGRATAGALAAAFFAHTLSDDPAAGAWLSAPDTEVAVTVEVK